MMGKEHKLKQGISKEKLEQLRQATGGGPVLILTHDNPDPDALASGMAFAFLLKKAWGIRSRLVYSGVVERAENVAMLKLLTPDWKQGSHPMDYTPFSAIALVDTQPGAGNNSLPPEILPHIVLDHHLPRREGLTSVAFVDVRPEIGATVSLVYDYLEGAGQRPDSGLATAMFYGVKTDTRGLSRGASRLDKDVYIKLLNRLDRSLLQKIEQAGLSREYFQAFSQGLGAATVYGSSVFAFLGKMSRPDLAAELADLLIRLENARACLCLGQHGDILNISLRTKRQKKDAGVLIQALVPPPGMAGGHGAMAGGQMQIGGENIDALVGEIRERFLKLMEEEEGGVPLLEN